MALVAAALVWVGRGTAAVGAAPITLDTHSSRATAAEPRIAAG